MPILTNIFCSNILCWLASVDLNIKARSLVNNSLSTVDNCFCWSRAVKKFLVNFFAIIDITAKEKNISAHIKEVSDIVANNLLP